MSLGLPEFGSRGNAESAGGVWRLVQVLGFAALVYAALIAATEGRDAYSADRALERVRAGVRLELARADHERKTLRRNADLLVATASVESSPERVLDDLTHLLPEGVSIVGLKMEYMLDATARADFDVVARGPEAYDRFLAALSGSEYFGDLKPGSESRPGLLRATVIATHHPKGKVR